MPNKHNEQGQPRNGWAKAGTVIAVLVPALTLLGGAGYQLMEFGNVKATVKQQSLRIDEYREQNRKLSDTNDELSKELSLVRSKLAATENKLVEADKQLGTAYATIEQHTITSDRLQRQLSRNAPCIAIQQTIAKLEATLARNDYFRLADDRREETKAQIIEHQGSLRACLSRAS
ncbi:hypothetical protein QQ999_05340 [Pseudomonas fluorescens]